MAEIPKINDIASQLSTASRLVASTDYFWVYATDESLGEQYVKIPAELVRAYLTNGIAPVIDENGNWLIGGKETGVKAEGVTPMLRSNEGLGIEVSYDKGKTWQMLALYSELNPGIQSLVDAINDIGRRVTKNTDDIATLSGKIHEEYYMTQEQYDALKEQGDIDPEANYNIFEE